MYISTGRNVPCYHTELFHNAENNQTILPIDIYEGLSNNVANNTRLDGFNIMIDPKPAGQNKVEVTFKMDKTHTLQVLAIDTDNQNESKAKVIDWATNIICKKQLKQKIKEIQSIRKTKYIARIRQENNNEIREFENWIKKINISRLSYGKLHAEYMTFKKKLFIKKIKNNNCSTQFNNWINNINIRNESYQSLFEKYKIFDDKQQELNPRKRIRKYHQLENNSLHNKTNLFEPSKKKKKSF